MHTLAFIKWLVQKHKISKAVITPHSEERYSSYLVRRKVGRSIIMCIRPQAVKRVQESEIREVFCSGDEVAMTEG